MKQFASYSLGVLVALVLSTPLLAQDGAQLPPSGSYGISFGLPDGGGAGVGIRRMLSPSTNLGLLIQFNLNRTGRDLPAVPQETRTSFLIGLGPDLRRYFLSPGPVQPYLHVGTAVAYREAGTAENQSEWWFEASVGVGGEWFPTDGVSVSGTTGVDFGYRSADLGQGGDGRQLVVALYRSELLLNLYF